jgi:hypothetical protein
MSDNKIEFLVSQTGWDELEELCQYYRACEDGLEYLAELRAAGLTLSGALERARSKPYGRTLVEWLEGEWSEVLSAGDTDENYTLAVDGETFGLVAGPIQQLINAARSRGILIAADNAREDEAPWVLHFGAYGETKVLAWGSLDDALEDAASVLPKGCFCDDQVNEAYREATDAYNAVHWFLALFTGDRDLDDDAREEWAHSRATVDCAYTESGYIASHEWGYYGGATLAVILAMPEK